MIDEEKIKIGKQLSTDLPCFVLIAGGLFGQKPATGFGATFGAPASSANTGFSGLGTFTPASGKI